MTQQILTFSPSLSGKKYELEILEVYPGKKYKDLAISELSFLRPDNQAWRVQTTFRPERIDFSIETSIGNLVDRYVSSSIENDGGLATLSLILRSDQSFDLHSMEDTGYDDLREWHASGMWSRRSDGKLKLTGGLEVSGDPKTSSFSETITVAPNFVEGEEYF